MRTMKTKCKHRFNVSSTPSCNYDDLCEFRDIELTEDEFSVLQSLSTAVASGMHKFLSEYVLVYIRLVLHVP